MSCDSIDGIVLAAGWTVRGMNPCHSRLFSLPKNFQTVSGADPASCSMDNEFLPRNKTERSVNLTTHIYVVLRFYTECINEKLVQPVARGHMSATKCYVAREGIRNEKNIS
jgi:hypothetical protein